MRSEYTLPIGIKTEYDRDMDFGICDKCEDFGVKLYKRINGWFCNKCTNSRFESERGLNIKEISPTN